MAGDLARVEVPDLLTFLNMGRRSFLNTLRVDQGILRSGDEIGLGPAHLRFKLDQTSLMAHPGKPR